MSKTQQGDVGFVLANPKVSFGRAFAAARKVGAKEFEWRGARYHTRLAEEVSEDIPDDEVIILN